MSTQINLSLKTWLILTSALASSFADGKTSMSDFVIAKEALGERPSSHP